MKTRYIITEEDMNRYEVLSDVISGRITLKEAKDLTDKRKNY